MDILERAEEKKHGLGLGWLLAIALCGGVLLFAALGYLLVWRIRVRAQPCTTRVYANDDHEAQGSGDMEEAGAVIVRPCPKSSSSVNVLSKKRFYRSDSSMSRLSMGLSMNSNTALWQPPILPPLPTHNSSFFGKKRKASTARSWVDDGAKEHGPKVERRSWRESWFGRDSWMAMMVMGAPTLPDVGNDTEMAATSETKDEEQVKPVQEQTEQLQPQPQQDREVQKNELHVQKKRQSKPPLLTSQTAPQLSRGEDDSPPRGRSRVPGNPRFPHPEQPERSYQPQPDMKQLQLLYQQRIRASATETDLKDILRSTEQRLRDGTSRSPVKTPRGSPTKNGSPTKTPRSCRTGSSSKTAGRMTPSPSKKSLREGTPTKTQSRNASVSSIGSAAKSLINAATEELQLPGGMGSPSRLRGSEWDPAPERAQKETRQQDVQRVQTQQMVQRRRSKSLDSDVSSCLSTLYSVGDTEEYESARQMAPEPIANRYEEDPFVDARRMHQEHGLVKKGGYEMRPQQQVNGPRPLRRNKTVAGMITADTGLDQTAIPAPLRTISVNSHLGRAGRQMGEKRHSRRLSLVLQAPEKSVSEDVKPKMSTSMLDPASRASLTDAISLVSMVSDSAYTDITVSDSDDTVLGDDEELPTHQRGASSVSSIMTPTRNGRSLDLSSSPLDEREVLSILMQTARPKRELPMPPSRITLNDDTIITPLSPSPRRKQPSRPPSRRASISSIASSVYDQDFNEDLDAVPTDLPTRRATSSGLGANFRGSTFSVSNTVAELRRMNSVVSSYSVASVASTAVGEGLTESPTLPSLRGGGFSPARTNSKNESMGKRNYLNLGNTSPSKGKSSPGKGKGKESRSGSRSRSQSRSGIPIRNEKTGQNDGKENESKQRTVRFDVPSSPTTGLREGRQSSMNLAPPQASTVASRSSAGMTAAQMQRASVDSLGLYDQDGFLKGSPKSSPDRDAAGKTGRLRM